MASQPDAPAGPPAPKAPTGVRGLDEITWGGLPKGRSTLVPGAPGSTILVSGSAGTGKTTLGAHLIG
jgi:circadian clock protein KaiC